MLGKLDQTAKGSRPVWVEVDLERIKDNFKRLKKKVDKEVLISPVVKADAYGHGVIPVSQALVEAGADRFAVALPEEGRELREAGFEQPIHVLGEVLPGQIPLLLEFDLIPTISKMVTVNKLSELAEKENRVKKIHIKVDTGMGRIGVRPEQAVDFVLQVEKLPGIEIEGLITHFACADESDKSYTKKQWKRFRKVVSQLQEQGIEIPVKHVANSAVVLDLPSEMYMNMLRPGIMVYGLYPSNNLKDCLALKPALTWKAKIIYLKNVQAGEGISYGATFFTERKTRVATIPLGYADGYSRLFSNQGEVLIKGQKVPVIGRVCMDQFMVDVTEIPNVETGEEVVLIGRQGEEEITADELAEQMGTINYEVVCNISDRIPRIYK